uniref:Putative rna-binding protein 34 n=2 Tax=Culex tarsalis TaxID=7177 RepID=A0A1Q3EXI5_CULTA
MGKKSKKTKAVTNGTNSTLEPATVETVPEKNVGLLEKSKKIKKKKKDKPVVAATVEQVTEAVGNGELVVTKPKKKKKNKDKPVPVAEEQPAKVVQNGAKHKKKKKNKQTKHDGEQPADVPEQKESNKKAKTQSKKKKNKAPAKPKAIPADNDVVTSESESEAEEVADESTAMDRVNQSVLSQHSSAGKDSSDEEDDGDDSKEDTKSDSAKEAKKSTRIQGPEYSVFVGNLPTTIKKGAIKKLFMPYGRILTIRFRTSDGVSLFKKKDRKEAKALICYVRFSSKEEAIAACAMNGQMVEENRIRVSLQTQKHLGHIASTVFVGNIHRKTTDNDLYDFFSRVGEIEYVRQISDKGIGYVCFKKGVSIAKAIKLNQQMLNGRPLRISKVDPNLQHKRKNKKGNLVDKRRPPVASGAAKRVALKTAKSSKEKGQPTEFHGTVAKKQSGGKKQKHHKKGGGAEYKKKILAQKLAAAAGKPKKFR